MSVRPVRAREAAIATACYADIFDYPLQIREFHLWSLFGGKRADHIRALHRINGYIVLRGREHLVKKRLTLKRHQEEKWNIARRFARIAGYIPTVRLVGVTGGLAMNNAGPGDDVDLFIVAADGTVWITRLITVLLADLYGMRRKPGVREIKNTVCLNMFVSVRGMPVPAEERDCYSAHEILQMEPLLEEKGTYHSFISDNAWVRSFLPRAWTQRVILQPAIIPRTPSAVIWIFRIFEFWAKLLQIWYMKKPKTKEIVTDNRLRFHPSDARVRVKQRLGTLLKKYNIPLDNIFYAR
jgi:hypothetical protein